MAGSREGVEQGPRRFRVGSVEPFSEPAIDGVEHGTRLVALAAVAEQSGETHGRSQLERSLRALARDVEGTPEAVRGFLRLARPQPQLATHPLQLGGVDGEPVLLGNRGQCGESLLDVADRSEGTGQAGQTDDVAPGRPSAAAREGLAALGKSPAIPTLLYVEAGQENVAILCPGRKGMSGRQLDQPGSGLARGA